MRLSRRNLLATLVATAPLVITSRVRAQADSALLTLVLDGFDSTDWSDEGPRSSALAAFLDRGLPLAAVVRAGSALAGAPIVDQAAQAGLLELLAPAPDVADQPRYAQMRGAEARRAELIGGVDPAASATSLIVRGSGDGLDLPAFRASGFRVLMAVDGAAKVDAVNQGRGQLLLRGGRVLETAAGAPPLSDQVAALLRPGGSAVAVLPLDELDGPRGTEIAAAVEVMADTLAHRAQTGETVLLRPLDHLLQSAEWLPRQVAVVVEATRRTETAAAHLLKMLEGAGVAATVAGPIEVLDRLGRPGGCLSRIGAPNEMPHRCLLLDPDDAGPVEGPADIVLHPPGVTSQWTGVRSDARFHVAADHWTTVFTPSTPLSDAVLFIAAEDYVAPQDRSVLLRSFEQLAAESQVQFWALADWADHLLAPDPLRARYVSARVRATTDPAHPASELPPSQRAEFLADARAAWAYIEALTDTATGHAIPTLSLGSVRTVNVDATLWDSGSQINGILAAARIGLISRRDSAERIARLISNIPAATLGGARLPPAIFTMDSLQVVRADFDVCDLGRFLVALDNAVAQGALSRSAADAVTDPWDMEAAVRDGRLHSFRAGRWEDITISHCTDYIRPAFQRRGFEVQNLYPRRERRSDADWHLAIMSDAAAAGSIGAEPSLLAHVEQQTSAAARLLSALLFDAQLEWYETGGGYRIVSETPLDRAPWFVYQGLALDIEGPDAWTANSPDRSAEFRTAAFRRSAEVIVAKAAYLWLAQMPHPFTEAVVAEIRRKCRIEGTGFAVGVYAEAGRPLAGYFDINTNGIILSALAMILGNPQPRIASPR